MNQEKEYVLEVAENVFFVEGEGGGAFPHSNSLMISDEKGVLIDTGIGDSRLGALKPRVDVVLNTHCHVDHIRGNHLFSEVWACGVESGAIRSFDAFKRFFGIWGQPMERVIEERLLSYGYRESRVEFEFSGGDVLDFGKTRWEVVLTPGHSPGHCCFYERERGILFSGDIDLTGFGPWYGWPNCSVDDFITSIELLMDMDINILASGHRRPIFSDIASALRAYLGKIYAREEEILDFLKGKHDLKQIVDKAFIYGSAQRRDWVLRVFEENMVRLHLERLIRAGKVEFQGGTYRTTDP
ncbi:MAG: MBL fold metallo-hydrolase [Candidatus Geothermarchaeales archaeon]